MVQTPHMITVREGCLRPIAAKPKFVIDYNFSEAICFTLQSVVVVRISDLRPGNGMYESEGDDCMGRI